MTLAAPPKRKPLELTFWRSMAVAEPLREDRAAIRDVPWKQGEVPVASAQPDAGVNSWKVAWERPFPQEASSVGLAAINGKLFAMGADSCVLLNPDGGVAPTPRLPVRGRIFVDPAKERVYVSGDGVTELAAGATRLLQPLPGVAAELFVGGDRLLAWGATSGLHPHGGPMKREASVAVLDLARADAQVPKLSVIGVSELAVAATAETVALALPGELHFLGWDLSKGRALAAAEPFTPLSMSLDARGRAWLIVGIEKRVELWVIEPDGRRRVRTRLESAPESASAPLFDREGRVYLQTRRRLPTGGALSAFTPAGALAWTRPLSGNGGATVTGDDRVLLTDGDTLSSLDAAGVQTVLFRAPEPIVTAPIVVGDALALATGKSVLFLTPSHAK